MSASVRAKFRCLEVTQRFSHDDAEGTRHVQYKVKLGAVYVNKNGSPCEENKSFYAMTPSGQIEIDTISEAAASAFEPGQAYYIDFTAADG